MEHNIYNMADIEAIRESTISSHGTKEWQVAMLSIEFHRHLGIYLILGVKMGLRAVELLKTNGNAPHIISYTGRRPPLSCLNDGLQVSTGATLGHGLIRVESLPDGGVEPKALFKSADSTIELSLKSEFRAIVERDVSNAKREFGTSAEYWAEIRRIALLCWRDWSREDIFDLKYLG